jgi:hypothetical protein
VQRVNRRVSRHRDGTVGHAFANQAFPSELRRREVILRHTTDQPAIRFFRKRMIVSAGAESRFHVCHSRTGVERRQRCTERRCCISLNDDDFRLLTGDNRRELPEKSNAEIAEGLAGCHHVEVVVGLKVEELDERVEQLTMLRGDTHARVKEIGQIAQGVDDGRHLDGIRTSTQYTEHLHGAESYHRDARNRCFRLQGHAGSHIRSPFRTHHDPVACGLAAAASFAIRAVRNPGRWRSPRRKARSRHAASVVKKKNF